jgi:hypothetical protein
MILELVAAALVGFGIGRISHAKFSAELAKLEAGADAELLAAVAKVKAAAAKLKL